MKIRIFCISTLLFLITGNLILAQQRGPDRRESPSANRIEPEDLTFEMGIAKIPDRETFKTISYRGPEVGRDAYRHYIVTDRFGPQSLWLQSRIF